MNRKALIIDDERLARKELRRLLEAHPGIEILAEAANIIEAREAIQTHNPDLLFLDIQMPGGTGFDLLEQLDTAPEVIFTTAYDAFALKAFEVSALDYLLKPIAAERLDQALQKLTPVNTTPLDHLFVKDGDRCWFLKPGELTLLESEGNYTRLFFNQQKPLIHRSLQSLEDRLPKDIFFRANRKHLINLNHILNVGLNPADNLVATLKGNFEIELSRRQSTLFKSRLSL
ncbi:MAG: response regulator [Acidobacteria bacterium]|nr:response regulator [Acidobacteriota bacterium]